MPGELLDVVELPAPEVLIQREDVDVLRHAHLRREAVHVRGVGAAVEEDVGQQERQLGARLLALEAAGPERRGHGIVVLVRNGDHQLCDGRPLLLGQPHDGAVVDEAQAPVRQHQDVASVGVRVEETVLEDLMPVHVVEQPREARPVQRHGHLLLGPARRRGVAACAHASTYESGGEVARPDGHGCEEGLLLAHLAHVHRSLHG
mmetsp:Transcript_159008/g.486620  ORF Transcript_159008/g.486620 Transcript_159008/m.486620 type:complete len:204 (+) Transcript_159008:188-799(+)